MKTSSFLVRLFWLLMAAFLVGRVGFMLYNAALWPSAADAAVTGLSGRGWLKDMILAWFHGAAQQDLITVAALMGVPALMYACGVRRLRLWATPYYIVMSMVVALIVVADIVLYEFWQFKLGTVVLTYAAYPEGTANSVSTGFIASCVGAYVAFTAAIAGACIWATPRRAERGRHTWATAAIALFCFAMLCMDSGVGSAYFSDRLFLNHAAVNPVYGFASTVHVVSPVDRHAYFADEERAELFSGLYEGNGACTKAGDAAAEALTDTLLRTQRPDVLVVFVESFGSEFVTSLGGAQGTTPSGRREDVDQQLERLIPEGIWWTDYYSNSFRTDRGTASAFCGWTAYTDLSLMVAPELHAALPSLAQSMRRAGYETAYLYPGAPTNMGKGRFLRNIGFERIYDDTAFTAAELDSPWGAHDMTSARKTARIMSAEPRPAAEGEGRKPRLMVYQTVSSHEPWTVPYCRLTDPVQNAFAYTDAAIGQLVDSLKASAVWDNLLMVIIPDHGHLYRVPGHAATTPGGADVLHQQAFDDPEFFHSPMLWLGGAIREPRRMDVLMNQSDLCATLLGQLGVDHSDYPWSRNVLSRDYTYPFVCGVYPAGVFFRDASGSTVYDVSADRNILQHDAGQAPQRGPKVRASAAARRRTDRAKAILQTAALTLPEAQPTK